MKQESTRQKKFSKLIQEELSEILQRQIAPPAGIMASVTIVRSSPDLRSCKIFLSAFPDARLDELFAFVEEKYYEIKRVLGQRIGKQVRYIPEIHFFRDDTLSYAEKMDKLIDDAIGTGAEPSEPAE